MNIVETKPAGKPRRLNYWRLWLIDAVLVSAGVLYCLAVQYGTWEFFGVACLMASLPFIPVIVLVGGAGSTVFALTRVWIEKSTVSALAGAAFLVGPALIVTVLCGLLATIQSPERRLGYISRGTAPASAGHVEVAGYSAFLSEQWLAVFNVSPRDFQAMVARAELAPADDFEFRRVLEQSALKNSRLIRRVPAAPELPCFKRVFKPGEEHERGEVYALFDAATSTGVVFRESRD